MHETFNIASLTKHSKAELQGLLANYQAKLAAPQSEPERAAIKSKIDTLLLVLQRR